MSQAKTLKDANIGLPSIEELLKISVKIVKTKENGAEELLGTGTIVFDGVDYYVLTAAHCFRDDDGNDNCGLDEVLVVLYDKDAPVRITPDDWWKSGVEDDAAWLKIKNPNNGFDFQEGLRLLGNPIDERACVYGYTLGVSEGRKYEYERKGLATWRCNENISANGGNLYDTVSGSSGGGLLVKVEEVIYCMGYVKKTFNDNAKLDDVVMHTMDKFQHKWGHFYVNKIEDVLGRPVRARECNEMKAHYAELWNELYEGIYKQKDVTFTLTAIKDAKRRYPNPKNVRQQEQIISVLLRKREEWPDCYKEAFLMALQDRGLWLSLYGQLPPYAGNLTGIPLARQQQERSETLIMAPTYGNGVAAKTGEEAQYEQILRAAFAFDFTSMRKLLAEWKPSGQWIVHRALMLNLFGQDDESVEQLKQYLQTHEFESEDEKFYATTACNLIRGDLVNRLNYKEFWNHGIDGISDLLIYMAGNIDKEKKDIGVYGIHHSVILGGEDIQSFPESLRLLQTIINTGMVPSMNFISILAKENWLKAVRHLFRYMPYPIAFYTLCYTDEKILRRVAQEFIFTEEESVRTVLPDLMVRLLESVGSPDRPRLFWQGLLQMTKQWYVAVPEAVWYQSFKKNVLHYFCYDIPTENVSYRDVLFLNIEEAVSHIKSTEHKAEVLNMLVDTIGKNSDLVNRLVDAMLVNDELLQYGGVAALVEKIIASYPLKDTYRIVHKFYTHCQVGDGIKTLIHAVVEKDAFEFGHDAGEAYGMLSYVLTDAEDVAKLKTRILQMDLWNCGISGGGFADVRYPHLEMYNKELRWKEDEWNAIKEKMQANITLIAEGRARRGEILAHFGKQYIDLLSNMKYFAQKINEVEGYSMDDVIDRVDAVLQELRGYSNVAEALSSDDYDKVVEGVWHLRDRYVDMGLDACATETVLLINRILLQKSTALEACMSLLAAMMVHKPEEMTSRYGVILIELLKQYSVNFDYEQLFVDVPAMYGWLRKVAKGVSTVYGTETVVKYWLEDETVNRFDYVE